MNCDSCDVPKNSLIAATTGRTLIRVCGVIASMSCVVMRSRTTRSMRRQAGADLVLDELADRADATVAEVVDVVDVEADLGRLAGAQAVEGRVAVGAGATRYLIVATMSSTVSTESDERRRRGRACG